MKKVFHDEEGKNCAKYNDRPSKQKTGNSALDLAARRSWLPYRSASLVLRHRGDKDSTYINSSRGNLFKGQWRNGEVSRRVTGELKAGFYLLMYLKWGDITACLCLTGKN